MYCPECGIEDLNANQFCRACGTDLRRIRAAISSPDSITASAVSAREEIGRAVAARIRETQDTYELKKVAEDVLPEIEKFLESPEEKRLRRIRVGLIVSSIGFGVALAFSILGAINDKDLFVVAGVGLATFFIGLSFVLNGILLTVPRKGIEDRKTDADAQRQLDGSDNDHSDLQLPDRPEQFASVTENTTRHLEEKQPVSRDAW